MSYYKSLSEFLKCNENDIKNDISNKYYSLSTFNHNNDIYVIGDKEEVKETIFKIMTEYIEENIIKNIDNIDIYEENIKKLEYFNINNNGYFIGLFDGIEHKKDDYFIYRIS